MVLNVAECRCGKGRRTIRSMCQNITDDSKAPRKLSVDLCYTHVRPCCCRCHERKYQPVSERRRVTVVSNKNLPVPFCLNRTAETKCCNCTKSPVEPLKEKKRDCKCHVDEDVGKKSLVDKAVSTSSVSVKKQTKTSQSDSFQQLSHKATSHTGSVRLSPQMKSRSAQVSSNSSSSKSVCTKSDDIPELPTSQFSKPNLLDIPFEAVLEKLERLDSFRKDNYFDCHSSSSLATIGLTDEHKCVYKYKINERLIPEPLNADQWGTSRCVICNKAQKSAVKKRRKTEEVSNGLPKSKESTKLNIVGRTETIEYTLPASFEGYVDSTKSQRFGNVTPACSYALRQQKGVVK